MINNTAKFLLNDKNIAWIITHFIFVGMAATLVLDYRKWGVILPYAGYFALGFFITTLALNPLIKVSSYILFSKLNRYRRQLGVASFSYALLHAICFMIKRFIDGQWIYLLHPAILPVLIVGLPLLFALALTSNQYSIKRLSFKKWKHLHKTVYIAEIVIFLHLILSGEKTLAIATFGPLFFVQALRRYRNNINKM